MMLIDVAETDALAVYQALVGVVTPRPIAWVTSVDLQGRVNLAPFSFYNTFGGSPPVVVFSPNRRPGGGKKDTLRNIEETGEFVINAAVAELAEQVNLSSTGLPPGESEVELTGLTAIPSLKVKPPRIQESPIHLECKLLADRANRRERKIRQPDRRPNLADAHRRPHSRQPRPNRPAETAAPSADSAEPIIRRPTNRSR